MKKLFYISLIVTAVIFGFASCATTQVSGKRKSPEYKTVLIDEKLDYLTTAIQYPSFDNYPDLSKIVKNTIVNNWESFKSYSKDEWNQMNAFNDRAFIPPFEYKVVTSVYSTNNYISVLINTYIFSGGAHGNTSLISYNYNLNSGKYENLTTVTKLNLNQISEICRNQLYEKLIAKNKNITKPSDEVDMKEMINTGAFPQAGNFEIFTVGKKTATVYFEPYSVAPYFYGIQTAEVKIAQ